MRYVIVRTENAGCFAGVEKIYDLVSRHITLTDARRLWYWAGASSLSELAVRGTSQPNSCKFPVAVTWIDLPQVIEVIEVTEDGRKSIESVPVWSS